MSARETARETARRRARWPSKAKHFRHQSNTLKSRLTSIDQSQLLTFWDQLSPSQRTNLASQIAALDLDAVPNLIAKFVTNPTPSEKPASIDPGPLLPQQPGLPRPTLNEITAREQGEALIRATKIACFTVAGGQGSRLGYDGPKGCYPAGAITRKPLFQMFAENIAANQARYGVQIPWYIMTSPLNDAQTRAFFKTTTPLASTPPRSCSSPKASCKLRPAIRQDVARLQRRHRLQARRPRRFLPRLGRIGATDDMRAKGIEHISYFQVDNPLAYLVDPRFIGLHAAAEDSSAEMSSKMMPKRDPAERVGVFCMIDGTLDMIEYSDLPTELAEKRNPDGSLQFGAGNPAIHLIGVDFIERVHEDPRFALPFHRAVKKVPYTDLNSGETVKPDEPNAVKLERFGLRRPGQSRTLDHPRDRPHRGVRPN